MSYLERNMLLDLITQITQITLGQGTLHMFKVLSNFKKQQHETSRQKLATFTSSHNTLGLTLKLCIRHFHHNNNAPCVYPPPPPPPQKRKKIKIT